MQLKTKKLVSLICAAAMMLSTFAFSVNAEEEEKEEKDIPKVSEDVVGDMEIAAENDNLVLYKSGDAHLLCVYDKANGKYWWSNPINADLSEGKASQKGELKGGLTLTYAEPLTRRTSKLIGGLKNKCTYTITDIENGVNISYYFDEEKFTVPVDYVLEENYLRVSVDTALIKEETPGKIITHLDMLTSFGAAEESEEGYFILPDGNGALVNFNNGKEILDEFEAGVYGEDITPVEIVNRAYGQNVSLPMYGIVKEDAGLMVVADKGDSCATLNAYVAGQRDTSYNSAFFDFEIRTDDEYIIGGTPNPLTVFERRGILVPEIELRYYPVSDTEGDVDYVDIAEKYREYLMGDYGVTVSETVSQNPLYVDLFGGVLKQESIAGFPITVQHKGTTFEDATEILTTLKDNGVSSAVVNYNHWTKEDIKEKVADEAKAASILGGQSEFEDLLEYAAGNNVTIFPEVDNMLYKSGNGYNTMFDTAVRVSNEFSRQIMYDLAYGIENQFYNSLALLSPPSYDRMFSSVIESFEAEGITNYSMGEIVSTLYGDYGKKSVSRDKFKGQLKDHFAALAESGAVLGDNPNAYLLPYMDHIINVPMGTSRYDLIDEEVPFYNIVLHGIKPISTTPINKSADIGDLILQSTVVGASMHFDLVAEEASELKDTKYDTLFYANADAWTEIAAKAYQFNSAVLEGTSDKVILSYEVSEDGQQIETVFDGGITISVNLADRTATRDGVSYNLYDYIAKEVIG